MNTIQVVSWVAFVFLLATVGLGIGNAIRWARSGAAQVPFGRILAHGAVQCFAGVLWVIFALSAAPLIGWAAFIVITVGQVLGDTLMLTSHRARHPQQPSGYGAAAAATLSFERPTSALHAILGAVAWFGMLGICIAISVM